LRTGTDGAGAVAGGGATDTGIVGCTGGDASTRSDGFEEQEGEEELPSKKPSSIVSKSKPSRSKSS